MKMHWQSGVMEIRMVGPELQGKVKGRQLGLGRHQVCLVMVRGAAAEWGWGPVLGTEQQQLGTAEAPRLVALERLPQGFV